MCCTSLLNSGVKNFPVQYLCIFVLAKCQNYEEVIILMDVRRYVGFRFRCDGVVEWWSGIN